jgi:hypothetical protein
MPSRSIEVSGLFIMWIIFENEEENVFHLSVLNSLFQKNMGPLFNMKKDPRFF